MPAAPSTPPLGMYSFFPLNQEDPLPRPNAFENDVDPYAPRTVTPLDVAKDSGWAVSSLPGAPGAAAAAAGPLGVPAPAAGMAHTAKRVRR